MTIRLTLYEKTLSVQQCLEILCQSLLCSGREADIALAKEYLTTTPETGGAAGGSSSSPRTAAKSASSKAASTKQGAAAVVDVLGTKSRIPFEASVDIVVNSAMEYFNSSASCEDGAMTLAKHCLRLFQDDAGGGSGAASAAGVAAPLEKIAKEKRLVDGIAMLASLGIEELPLKIRMCPDRCLSRKKSNY